MCCIAILMTMTEGVNTKIIKARISGINLPKISQVPMYSQTKSLQANCARQLKMEMFLLAVCT